MSKLGELLRSEREKRGLSLQEIGMSLKINPKILKAIEDGDQQNFPAKTFLRGFVKSYAQYLRLDVNSALQMFQEEYGNTRPEEPAKAATATASPEHPTHAPKYESSLKRPDDSALPVNNNNRIYTILVAILLLTLIAFVAKMMDKYQKESEVSKVTVEEPLAPTTTTMAATTASVVSGDASATVSGNPTVATPVSSAAQSATTTTSAVTTTTIKAAVSSTTTTTTLKPAVTTTTTLRPAVVSTTTTLRPAAAPTATTTTVSSTTTTAVRAANTEVILEALNRVSIRFTLNGGQKWESLELNPDQVHTFRSRTGVQLEISDGGAVNVIVNGRDRGVPGTIGKPLKVKYP